MSTNGLSGMASFIPEYINIHRFSTKFKIRCCFLVHVSGNKVSLETKFRSVCVFLIATHIRPFRFALGKPLSNQLYIHVHLYSQMQTLLYNNL